MRAGARVAGRLAGSHCRDLATALHHGAARGLSLNYPSAIKRLHFMPHISGNKFFRLQFRWFFIASRPFCCNKIKEYGLVFYVS